MSSKRHLWYIKIVLATLERSGNVSISFLIANKLNTPYSRSLFHTHALDEAHVVH